MCSFNTLQHNSEGYVLQCKSCNSIKVAFGTTILLLAKEQFYDLVKAVKDLDESYKTELFRGRKMIVLPTPVSTVSIALTPDELEKFLHLLTDGGNNLLYRQLFVFNEN